MVFISKREVGARGEQIALSYLTKKGFILIEKNFRVSRTEIDLIMRKDNMLVFVEVKTRRSRTFGLPLESINFKKKRNMVETACQYIEINAMHNLLIRFDAVGIFLSVGTDLFVNSISHVENVVDNVSLEEFYIHI